MSKRLPCTTMTSLLTKPPKPPSSLTVNGSFRRIKRSPFITKLLYWEHWPFYIVYTPVYFYFIWLAVKSHSLLFFTASNPGVDTGGFYGESKISVLDKIPRQFV